MEESFDYVIVGAGSAGCAVAARLSEDPDVSVLVLEAGGKDRSPNIKIPAAFAKQFKTKLDWDYSTGPEPHLDGRDLYVPRGKSFGGSSSMNAMMYVRGRPLDYDGWREAGCHGLGLRGRAALLQAHGEQRARGLRGPRRRRPGQRRGAARARPLTARFLRRPRGPGSRTTPTSTRPSRTGSR